MGATAVIPERKRNQTPEGLERGKDEELQLEGCPGKLGSAVKPEPWVCRKLKSQILDLIQKNLWGVPHTDEEHCYA